MRKILLSGIFFIIILGGYILIKSGSTNSPKIISSSPDSPENKPTLIPSSFPNYKSTKSVFVPDWNLNEEAILHNGYDRWIYFGGEEKIPVFVKVLYDKELWLTVKANEVAQLNPDRINELKNKGLLANIKGIVLDLEINGLASDEFISEINSGVKDMYQAVKKEKLLFAIAVYGDLLYRKRPYDLRFLNDNSDEIMVMAYDFSKSYGEPGPNFPFQNKDKYGYDFKKMVDDYLRYISPQKLTVVLGMFGYDWELSDGKPLKAAQPMSLFEIEKNFLGKKCYFDKCRVSTDPVTMEKHIRYFDEVEHQVYFEGRDSAAVKIDYLKAMGLGSVAYWAWGYF